MLLNNLRSWCGAKTIYRIKQLHKRAKAVPTGIEQAGWRQRSDTNCLSHTQLSNNWHVKGKTSILGKLALICCGSWHAWCAWSTKWDVIKWFTQKQALAWEKDTRLKTKYRPTKEIMHVVLLKYHGIPDKFGHLTHLRTTFRAI